MVACGIANSVAQRDGKAMRELLYYFLPDDTPGKREDQSVFDYMRDQEGRVGIAILGFGRALKFMAVGCKRVGYERYHATIFVEALSLLLKKRGEHLKIPQYDAEAVYFSIINDGIVLHEGRLPGSEWNGVASHTNREYIKQRLQTEYDSYLHASQEALSNGEWTLKRYRSGGKDETLAIHDTEEKLKLLASEFRLRENESLWIVRPNGTEYPLLATASGQQNNPQKE